jgi:hypothetical protein
MRSRLTQPLAECPVEPKPPRLTLPWEVEPIAWLAREPRVHAEPLPPEW